MLVTPVSLDCNKESKLGHELNIFEATEGKYMAYTLDADTSGDESAGGSIQAPATTDAEGVDTLRGDNLILETSR
jgi:hypothetical protein